MSSETQRPRGKILIVDDEPNIRTMLATLFESHGWETAVAATLKDARRLIEESQHDIILVDKNLPDGSGIDLAEELVGCDCETILMTAFASVDSAVKAVRLRLADYLPKPFDSMEAVAVRIERVFETLTLRRRNRALVGELQDKTSQLESLVVRDPLTKMFNHGFFQDALEREITLSRRHGMGLSLMFIDIDHFKTTNERHGHRVGDAMLKRFAQILNGDLRGGDFSFNLRQGDVVARYGHDKFALILPHTSKRAGAVKAEALRATVAKAPFADLGAGVVTVSIGLAAFPQDANDRAGLCKATDLALGAAKKSGRNCLCTYSPQHVIDGLLDEEELQRRSALLQTITDGGFDYWYQPIFDANSDTVYGFEALVRPDEGVFRGPTELLATAEALGRVSELGRTLRKVALASVVKLPSPYTLFVNLHPHEINDPTLTAIDELVDEHRERIVFEITEVSAIQDYDYVADRLEPLRERGYRVALDDLGAEYAGLQALARLGPDFVKLDGDLSRRARTDRRTARLIRHLIDFSREEGIAVIAEGIETPDERDVMRELGCNLMQGYLFGRPGPGFSHIQ